MRRDHDKERIIAELAKTPIVQAACTRINVPRSTFYRWRNEDPEFAQKADEAMSQGSLFINDIAESQLLQAIKEKNMTAIFYWLKHHHPVYTTRVEINGHLTHADEALTPEEEAVVRDALRLASPRPEKDEKAPQEKHDA